MTTTATRSPRELARRIDPVGAIGNDESLPQYFRRAGVEAAEGRQLAMLPDTEPLLPDTGPLRWGKPLDGKAGDMVAVNDERLEEQRLFGRHYPPVAWGLRTPRMKQRLTAEMKRIGRWRQSKGDNRWHYDSRRPWMQPMMKADLLCQWMAYRWNRSMGLRHVTVGALRLHYARHDAPLHYQMLDALLARHPSRIPDRPYFEALKRKEAQC